MQIEIFYTLTSRREFTVDIFYILRMSYCNIYQCAYSCSIFIYLSMQIEILYTLKNTKEVHRGSISYGCPHLSYCNIYQYDHFCSFFIYIQDIVTTSTALVIHALYYICCQCRCKLSIHSLRILGLLGCQPHSATPQMAASKFWRKNPVPKLWREYQREKL